MATAANVGAMSTELPGWPEQEDQLVEASVQRLSDDLLVAQLVDAEWAGVTFLSWLNGSLGSTLRVVVDGQDCEGNLIDLATTWLMLGSRQSQTLISTSAITLVRSLQLTPGGPTTLAGSMARTHGVPLRALARERRTVTFHQRGGGVVSGSIRRVGKDAVQVVQHCVDQSATAADPAVILPYQAIAFVSARV